MAKDTNIQTLESELSDLVKERGKLQEEINTLDSQIKGLPLVTVEDAEKRLTLQRSYDARNLLLGSLDARIQEARDLRVYTERLALAGQWPDVDRAMGEHLRKIRTLTGAGGLRAELIGLQQVLNTAQNVALVASQDAMIKTNKILNLYTETWQALDRLSVLLDACS